MSARIEPLLTVDDLDAMPDDGNHYEIIEGELIVTRTPGVTHQTICWNIAGLIRDYLLLNPVGKAWFGLGAVLSNYDAVIPDIFFVSNARLSEVLVTDRITGVPDLAIEVISPGSENARRDRIAKRQLYGKFGVKEYWIVDPEKRNIEVYLLDGLSLMLHAVYSEGDPLTSSVLLRFTCKVETVFQQ